MSETSQNNKRIAKNTVFLYIRQVLLLFVSLLTSRIVLEKLGFVNFGIYNVIAGFVLMLSFFSSSLSNATQRFLNIELGKNNIDGANNVFNLHLLLYGVITLIFVFVAETAGLYIVKYKLYIPPDRLHAACMVFHYSIASFAITLMGIVFNAAIVAHEDMKFYSYIGIVEGLAKLLIAYAIGIGGFDKLAAYAFMLMVATLFVQLSYAFYSHMYYNECKYRFYWNTEAIVITGRFIGWNFLATFIYIIKDQGLNMMLNVFFGPVVNAARAVAYQVNGAISNFSTNFFTAVRPQIVKSYAANDIDYLNLLFFKSSKYSLFLIWLLCLPTAMCMPQLLNLWLKEVPPYTEIFTIWLLAESLPAALTNPTWSIVISTGNLRGYVVWTYGALLLTFPTSYIALNIGMSPASVFMITFTARMLQMYLSVIIANKEIRFGISRYVKEVISPFLAVVLLSLPFSLFLCNMLPDQNLKILYATLISTPISLIAIWLLGMTQSEKYKIRSIIIKRIKIIKPL